MLKIPYIFSQLGQLPEFGTGRGLTSNRATSSGFHDLDDALESLLGDDTGSEVKRGGRQRNKSQIAKSKGSTASKARYI